nr:DEAD/DEAH box helicase family protein [Porcincola intestinalis]
MNEAEDEIASAFSLPDFPTANTQKRMIEARMEALYAGEISIPSDVVDEILRTGGNRDRSQLRIIYNFMIEQTPEEYMDFVRREYGRGGKGFTIDGQDYSVWFDEMGMQIAVGHTVEDRILDKAVLSWEDVTSRIQQLLGQGEYAPQVVLDAARNNALTEHAQALAYMEGDMAEGVAELVFADTELFAGGYPEKTERIAEYLSHPENVTDLVQRLEGLADAYAEDKSIMRFQYYNPDRMLAQFQKFMKEAVPFDAREGFSWIDHQIFITQDEIDAYLCRGGIYSDGRLATYAFYLAHEDNRERADFLKDRYGTGGQSHALSGADASHADYSAKGLKLERGNYGSPDASTLLKWLKVAQRVDYLIQNDRFLTAGDFARMSAYEREQMANRVIGFYSRLSEEIERPFTEDFFNEAARKELPVILEDPNRTAELLEKMDAVLAGLPLDSEDYEKRLRNLTELHGYADGSFTIFPQPVKDNPFQIDAPTHQLSIFDFMQAAENLPVEMEQGDVTEETAAEVESESIQESNAEEIAGESLEETIEDDEAENAARSAIEERVFDAMEATGTAYEDYSPEQMDVIYSAAEKGYDLKPLCNPAFSPEQMQLIVDIEGRMEAHTRASFHEVFDFIASNELSIGEINDLRAANNLPLEDVSDDGGIEISDETIPKLRQIVIDLIPRDREPERTQEPVNFHITDDDLGAGGLKAKFQANMDAIYMLKKLENEGRLATPEEQEVLSRFVGWGGISQAFDAERREWSGEYAEVKAALTSEEYREARASTLNAFYTSPTVIKAMYEVLGNMGLSSGNVLEPSCGVGNFMGLVPETMNDLRMYGVELDSISGRIARQLYQRNEIAVQGFEETEFPDSFFDCVIGNVPFGQYKVNDRRYDRYNFLIHDYFIARSLDLTRPGGVVAVVTSSGTMDKQNESVRQYLANRADLIGAIRLPNNAFMRNANTGVVADILFFQKRDRAALTQPDWVHLGTTPEGHSINAYFVQHPEMVLGEFTTESTQYGKQEVTVKPIEGANLADQLHEACSHLQATIEEMELTDSELEEVDNSIPADSSVKNFSFTNVDGNVYYRENSRMHRMELPAVTTERVLGMIEIRNTVQKLLDVQMNNGSDAEVALIQRQLNEQYDNFTVQYDIISSNANKRAFQQDSSYCLLSSLEILDEEGNLERKADIFSKRTIRRAEPVTSVDTASEALALSIGEKAGVDLPYMAELTGKPEEEIISELQGVIFKNPLTDRYETSDAYLSGNVREKLQVARRFAENNEEFAINVSYLEKVQPKELDASEIEVRLGATWVKPEYVKQFMGELFQTPRYMLGRDIQVRYAEISGQWNISGKTRDSYGNSLVTSTYGTRRANAYRLLEDALNLKDTKIYDTIKDADGEHRVLNKKETMLAQQKQEMIREAFKEWIFRDMDRREDLCKTYNELFNSVRPREYDGSHIRFVGMTPEIQLMQHQKNAIAHVLYGDNTLLAHCVGAGKTFQMVAAGMESKRLGLAQKCLYVVPNHLTEQWGGDFLRLYPGANILVATKKDFEPANRKKFCSRIATGDYDAIIIGHSQFEKIPLSKERQITSIERQIDDLEMAIEEAKEEEGSRYTVKQMEKTRKTLETKLEKLNDQSRKDDVVTFEQLGVDRLFVDESHSYKNLFLYTKMRNVAGISQTDAQKSSDMFMKCQYMDELTGGKGVTFATGTPVSNSMVELYTIMRYLQYDTLQKLGLGHFDSWAASFGETVTAIELSPEGTGYRAKTRFARFFNLPELISLFKEAADVQTADMLNLPVPEAEYVNEVLEPSEEQKDLVASFAERAEVVRGGGLDPRIDNMLKITNDGRKCALDQRLINDMLPDAPESKVNLCVENTFKVWQDSTPEKGTQLIFCDLSTPKSDGTFNVYDDLKAKLMGRGVPEEEIAFIHDANTETKKAELFAKVRAGQIRILLGSTPKLGAGTNVQDRLIALHHLDCPWKPSDLEQQEGRILRQGNRNGKVKIFRYVTEGTFDAYMWQILENKQKFISQIMTSKSPVRACEDVDDTALSYAEIKALATGNPYIKEKMDLDIQVSKLKLMKANHTSVKYRLETDIARTYPVQITATKERLAGLKSDLAAAKPIIEADKDHFQIIIGGKEFMDRKEAGTALIAACAGLKAVNTSGQIGEYQGFSLTASFDSFHQVYQLTIKRQCSCTVEVGKDALGNIQRITNALAGIEKKLTESEQKFDNLQKQLATAQEEVRKPFAQEAELAEKSARLAELNSLLNMDERDSPDTFGIDENTDASIEAAEKSRQPVFDAGKASNTAGREAERASDAPVYARSYADRAGMVASESRDSVLDKLHEKQEQVSESYRTQAPLRKYEYSL